MTAPATDATDNTSGSPDGSGDSTTSRGSATTRKAATSRTAATSGTAATTRGATGAGSWPAAILEAARSLLGRPLASYHLILAFALLLTTFGLVMVLSASSVEGYSKEGSAYGLFATQVIFAFLGLVVFYVMLRVPVQLLRRVAAPMMVITTVLLALVLIPGIGTLSQGARRWFVVYGLSVQPSELVKVALCVWGAHLLASRRRENASLKELLIPLLPVAVTVCGLIILEPNLSTTITIAIIVGALLWFAGLPVRVFISFVVAGAALAVVLALVESYRSERVMSFLGNIDDPQGAGYQARQATFALANGGVFGVGLGQSRAKWNYLPNAHNDFIFAIIGEELGLIGGVLVVILFAILAFVGFRIAARSADPFLRLMTATITVLITAQAFINIGYVIGLLPVTGIQLPLLSAGGTSTLTVLAMLGLLANAARHEPEAVAALTSAPPSRASRLFRLPTPVPYRPTRAEELRDRLDGRRGPAGRPGGRRPATPTPRSASARPHPGTTARPDQSATARAGGALRTALRAGTPWRRAQPGPTPPAAPPPGSRRGAPIRVDYRTGYSASPGPRAGARHTATRTATAHPRATDAGPSGRRTRW